MTLGTSPHPLGAALENSAEAEARAHAMRARATLAALWARGIETLAYGVGCVVAHRVSVLRALAGIYLFGLAALLVSAWGLPSSGETLPMGQAHVAFLMLAGAGMAVASLNAPKLFPLAREPDPLPAHGGLTGLGDILAQMSHELRTPLNAVIGFSEVMRHELHGPLNARYQEYAIHISESGDRMLKSSQDALAVAEAMTVLLAKTPHLPKEAVSAATLLDEAWRTVGGTAMVDVAPGAACTFVVERRATTQAVEHILREALSRGSKSSAVEVVARSRGSEHGLTIRARGAAANTSTGTPDTGPYPLAGNGGLNMLLARLLLEAQGARLNCGCETDGTWFADITFKHPG